MWGVRGCNKLSFAAQGQRVPPEPVGSPGAALGVVELASVADAAVFAAGRGLAAQLTVLVHGVTDPVDLGVVTDRLRQGGDSHGQVGLKQKTPPIGEIFQRNKSSK